MIKAVLLGILTAVIGFAIYLTNYLGTFKEVKISQGEAPVFTLLGKEHIGAYHKIVPVIEEVETWAKARGIDCTQSFGLYLEDPRRAEEERLHSWGGCWIDEKQTPSELPADFKIQKWTAPLFVKAVFDGSPGIGPLKVYPKVEKWFEENHLTRLPGTLEVYVVRSEKEMTTTYYFPAEKKAEAAP